MNDPDGRLPRRTPLDKQWDELMFLCKKESEFRQGGRHPKVLRLVSRQIDELAGQMGFTAQTTTAREFRSERSGGHIVRILTD
ncbi:MAG: hypothetical protein ABI868_20425 [Acidobacteriota bacterium]